MKSGIFILWIVLLMFASNNAAGQAWTLLRKDNPDTLTVYYQQGLFCEETSFEYVVDDEMVRARLERRTEKDEYSLDDYPKLEFQVHCEGYTLGKTREVTVYNVVGLWAVGRIEKPALFGRQFGRKTRDVTVWATPCRGRFFSKPPSLGLTQNPGEDIPVILRNVVSHCLAEYLRANEVPLD